MKNDFKIPIMDNPFKQIYSATKLQDYELALKLFLSNKKLKPEFFFDLNHANYVLGDIYFNLNNFKRAARCFLAALDSDPLDYMAWVGVGNAFEKLGMTWLSAQCFWYSFILLPQFNSAFNCGNMLKDMHCKFSGKELHLVAKIFK